MNNETKVGMAVIAGLVVLMGIVTFLGLFRFFSDSYRVYINFPRVTGLKPGNAVNYVGVRVGQVDKIEIVNNNARVSALIKNSVKIPEGSSFLLGSEGVMGSMFIDVEPPTVLSGKYLSPDAEANGSHGAGVNDFMMAAAGLLHRLEEIADALNSVFGNKDVQEAIIATTRNAKEITDNVNVLTNVLAEITGQNQQDINSIIKQMKGAAENLNQVTGRVNVMLSDIDNNGQTARELIDTLHSIKQASENFEKITKSVEELTSDPQTRQNAQDALKNAREASEKANKLLGVFTDSDKKMYFDFKYGDKPDDYRIDANLRMALSPRQFFLLGLADIGEANDLNLQFGYGSDTAALRAGVVFGKAGAGIDFSPIKRLNLFADAYDPNNFKLRAGGELVINKHLSFVGEALDVRKKAQRSFYWGVRGSF